MKIKKRQKPLLPSLREKKRYLAFEIVSKSKINDFSAVSSQIIDSSVRFIGELETAKAGIIIMADRWNIKLQKGIIRIGTKHVNAIMACLALIDSIGGKKAMIRSLNVSGTLKSV